MKINIAKKFRKMKIGNKELNDDAEIRQAQKGITGHQKQLSDLDQIQKEVERAMREIAKEKKE